MLSQSPAQVPVKYVSVQLGGVVGGTLRYMYMLYVHIIYDFIVCLSSEPWQSSSPPLRTPSSL